MKNIDDTITNLFNKMKELDKLSYAKFWVHKYSSLNKEQKKEVDSFYLLWQQEKEDIDIGDANVDNLIKDSLYFQKLKEKNWWLIWYKSSINFKSDTWRMLDDVINWFIPWKVYTIAWYSNVGKSTFTYFLLNSFLDKKILFFSTEVNKWLVLQNMIKPAFNIWFWESFDYIKNNKKEIKNKFKNLYVFDNIIDIDIIEKVIPKIKPDIVVIDFVQWLKTSYWDLYTSNAYIARKIQRIAIDNKVVMLSAAQITKSARWDVVRWEVFSIKWAWEYYESSDVVLHLFRPDRESPEDLYLRIEKNKFWPLDEFEVKANYRTWTFYQDNTL